MTQLECIELLQWAMPRLGLRWKGFRNVRGQVCKRLSRRCAELGVERAAGYRARLEAEPREWEVLAQLCRVTISRFGRDRAVWRHLAAVELPRLAGDAVAAHRPVLSAWSAGCAGGEEPYTLSLAWAVEVAPRFPAVRLEVLATDIDDEELERARQARYPAAVLTELDQAWRAAGFVSRDGLEELREAIRAPVRFARHDVRDAVPSGGPFDLVLCRNLVFTYFDDAQQRACAQRLSSALRPGGVLVVGRSETVPGLASGVPCVYRAP